LKDKEDLEKNINKICKLDRCLNQNQSTFKKSLIIFLLTVALIGMIVLVYYHSAENNNLYNNHYHPLLSALIDEKYFIYEKDLYNTADEIYGNISYVHSNITKINYIMHEDITRTFPHLLVNLSSILEYSKKSDISNVSLNELNNTINKLKNLNYTIQKIDGDITENHSRSERILYKSNESYICYWDRCRTLEPAPVNLYKSFIILKYSDHKMESDFNTVLTNVTNYSIQANETLKNMNSADKYYWISLKNIYEINVSMFENKIDRNNSEVINNTIIKVITECNKIIEICNKITGDDVSPGLNTRAYNLVENNIIAASQMDSFCRSSNTGFCKFFAKIDDFYVHIIVSCSMLLIFLSHFIINAFSLFCIIKSIDAATNQNVLKPQIV